MSFKKYMLVLLLWLIFAVFNVIATLIFPITMLFMSHARIKEHIRAMDQLTNVTCLRGNARETISSASYRLNRGWIIRFTSLLDNKNHCRKAYHRERPIVEFLDLTPKEQAQWLARHEASSIWKSKLGQGQ